MNTNYQKTTSNKIILICSDTNEGSTDIVCSFLNKMGKKFIRFSENDIVEIKNVYIKNKECNFSFFLKDQLIHYNEITSY